MTDSSPVTSPNRALRWGYRLRWFYLALVLFGALVWWGMWPAEALWVAIAWDSNPVLHIMDMVAFFWGLDEGSGWFSYDAGLEGVWGWPGQYYWGWQQGPGVSEWAWWSAGSFGVPVLLASAVLGFVGVRPSSNKRLPAKRRASWVALWLASGIGGLLLAGVVLMVLHLLDWLDPWIDAATVRPANTTGFVQSYRYHPGVLSWPPHMVWLIAACLPVAFVAVWFGVARREVYWRLERLTRYVGLLALAVLVFSIAGGLSNWGPWDGYWELDLLLWPTVWFSASTALLWAAACRVWLLFRLVKYEKQRVAMMTESPECFACGYDLSGSLRGGVTRCPECGVAVPVEVVEKFGRAVAESEGADAAAAPGR